MAGYRIDVDKKQCITPMARFSYAAILEPKKLPDSEKEAWSVMLLLPKKDPDVIAFMKEVTKIYVKVLVDKHGETKAKQIAQVCATPFRDGDDPKETASLSCADQLVGHFFINTKNLFNQPHVLAPTGKAIPPDQLTQDDIYSGAWGRALLSFWWYDKAGNKGISTTLSAIMKLKDDARLDAAVTVTGAEDMMSAFASEDAGFDMGGSLAAMHAAAPAAAAKKPDDGFSFM